MKINSDAYNELSQYAHLDGTEIGGYVNELLCLRDNTEDHGMTPEFSKSLNEELTNWLTRFRNECEIVEKTEPQPDKFYKELIWCDR